MVLAKPISRHVGFLTALLAGLGACGSSDGALGETAVLTGQLQGWNRGAGRMLVAQTLVGQTLGTANIAEDGGFMLTLPGYDAVVAALDETMFQDPCDGSAGPNETTVSCEANIEPKVARRAVLQLSIPGLSPYVAHESRPWPTSAEFPPHSVIYEYWDRAVEFTGKQSYREPQARGPVTITNQWDLHIKPGWNATVYYQPSPEEVAAGDASRRFVSERPSSRFSWYCCEN